MKRCDKNTKIDDEVKLMNENVDTNKDINKQPSTWNKIKSLFQPAQQTDLAETNAEESASDPLLQQSLDPKKTVWLKADIVPRPLNMEHKEWIKNPEELLDSDIIDYCLAHLKHKFGRTTWFRKGRNGLVSCLHVGKYQLHHSYCDFAPPAVSIISTAISEGQTHWITFSSHKRGAVKIYDSKNSTFLPLETKMDIYNATQREAGEPLEIEFVRCDQQANNFDCAVYAIANAFALCYGINPAHFKYNGGKQMREHLIKCMEAKTFTWFPSKFIFFSRIR